MMEKFYSPWKNTFWCKDGDDVHQTITQGSQKWALFLNPQTPTQLRPLTVVLHGPAGVGKTTLAKKVMLDWTRDSLANTLRPTFYLSCKELNRQGTCTFAELISKNPPDAQEARPEARAPAQKLLFVVDGFEQLQVPSGSLIHDICSDWNVCKPAPVLLGSLLKRQLCPQATLLVTTRPGALPELRPLLDQPLLVEVEGLSEPDRKASLLKHFEDEGQALRALALVQSHPGLWRLGAAPAACGLLGACLKLQLECGEDPAATCGTATALLLRFLCRQVTPPAGGRPGAAPLRAAGLLAAGGLWARTSVFDTQDLAALGLAEAALRPFLDAGVLQKDADGAGRYSFVHLSVQHFLAAVFYVLEDDGEGAGCRRGSNVRDARELLSKEKRLKNPGLAHVARFLFGLANERTAGELENTFGCRVTTGVARELLKSESFWTVDLSEVMRCLHESQEELLVRDAMDHVTEVSLCVKTRMDLVQSSFCLRHCQNLQKISLQVERGIFLESDTALERDAPVERSQQDHHVLYLWTDLCSVFSSNENLSFLDVGQSFLSHSSVRILCEQITHVTCHLQKVVIKNISPDDAYGDFCLAFVGKKTLTHLTLEGSVHSDKMLLLLCETLRHSQCNLQYLRLENCHLTGACCKELSSALIVNQRLTHLCLAKNNLGDSGVKLLCEGLSYPECHLQTLVLWSCKITRCGCKHISKLLQGDSSLTHLDLGFNPIATGLWFLCKALKKSNCNLKCLGLCGCSITSFCSQDLASALTSNQRLETLDLGQNIFGKNGIIVLFEALKQNSPLKTLRLKMDGSSVEMQTLLEEVKDSNPTLTIDCEDSRTTRSSYCDFFSSVL